MARPSDLLILASLAMLMAPVPANAATWYVDTSSQGYGDGSSWANARAFSSMSSLNIQAGDTVYINGGSSGSYKTYNIDTPWLPKGGTATNRVTYKIGQDSSHNGLVYFAGSSWDWLSGSISNVVISGDAGDGQRHFTLANPSTGTSPRGSVLQSDGGANNFRISYVNLGNILGSTAVGQSRVIKLNPVSNFEIDHVYAKMTDPNADSFMYAKAVGSTWDQNLFHDNIIYIPRSNGGLGADGLQIAGVGYSIYNNTIIGYSMSYTGGQHGDGWQSTGGDSYVKVYNNYIKDITSYGLFPESYYGTYTHMRIYNNVIRMTDPNIRAIYNQGSAAGIAVGVGVGMTISDVVVANNLIDGYNDGGPWGSIGFYSPNGPATYSQCYLYNNVIVNSPYIQKDSAVSEYDTVYLTAAQAPSNFVSWVKDAATNDYHLKSTSSLKDQGTAVTSSPSIAYDKDYVSRPQGSYWDIGPYEYYVSGPTNGACGTAKRTYIQGETFPGDYTLCSAGTPPATTPPLGTSAGATATWTCAGQNGGTSASCNATRSSTLNGACGPAAKAYSETETFPAGAYCSAGTASPSSPANPAVGSSTTWSCVGQDGGTTASCTASRATVPTAGLVGYWALNDASGTTAADGSGSGYTGTLVNGPTWTTGKISGALSFDGSDDEVDTTLSAPANSFTFGAWVRASATHEIDTQTTNDCSSGGCGGTSGQKYAFGAVHRTGSDSGAGLSIGTNGVSVYEHGDSYMPATLVYSANIGTGWTHVMVVYNNKQPTLYINGTAVKTGLTSPRSNVYAPVNFGCGEYGCFSGVMDEVRVYNRALSASEVQQVYLYTGASLNYHPADTGRDWVLSTGEVSIYNLCWKTPTCTPAPATTYVSNANLMWKSRADGAYHYAGGTCPLCWVSGL